ncbi:MAG TPA: CCA tRNA nucleotidyltransferase [Roseiflexaceae bacterium]|nr:CCA tRNA nucleotidyltransferase [Roseiflexaceae bacterium]
MDRDLGPLLDAALPLEVRTLLWTCAHHAAGRGMPMFVVGGTVRDILLGRPAGDLDLVVEGDAVALAGELVARLGGELLKQTAFGTATLTLPLGPGAAGATLTLDLAAARAERYERPAALPTVWPADLAEDLRRRDFTVNALAVELTPGAYGRLHDPFGGQADLADPAGPQLRVLHNQSFVDDPTRILRGVRLAARLGGALEPRTFHQAVQALWDGMVEQTTPQRIANELRLLLREPAPERAAAQLDGLGGLPHLAPELRWTPELTGRFVAARAAAFPDADLDLLYLGLALYPLSDAARAAVVARYKPSAAVIRLLRDLDGLCPLAAALSAPLPDSAIDRLLRPFGAPALRAAQLSEPAPVAAALARYQDLLRPAQTVLNGDDLRALGVRPGPGMGRLLAGLRAAVLDGEARGREEEVAWIMRHA